MQKKFIAAAALTLVAATASAQQAFQLKAKLNGLKEDRKVFLSYNNGEKNVRDSAIVKNGMFSFSGTVSHPVKASLKMDVVNPVDGPFDIKKFLARDIKEFYIDGGAKIVLSGKDSVKTANITGGKTQQELLALNLQEAPALAKMQPLIQRYNVLSEAKDSAGLKALEEDWKPLRRERRKVSDDFVKNNPKSWLSWDIVRGYASIIDVPSFEPLFQAIDASFRDSKEGREMADKLETARTTAIGLTAPEFSQADTAGKLVSLSSFRGKYVLVDFWASWCGPCRAENPNVVRAFNQFKDRNFDIISISLDDKKAPWLEAIAKDGMPWVHLSDLQGWKNVVAKMYGIRAVPQNLLLDPSGKIIAKNLRGSDLSAELSKHIH